MSKATIVISNYNYAQYVGSCIESCLDQDCQCDIIVVDDASTDESWELIKNFVPKIKAVRLKHNSEGNARGKNVGISLSSSEYITCLDSDDMLLPSSIKIRLDQFEANTDFVHGWSIRKKGEFSYKEIIMQNISKTSFKLGGRAKKLLLEPFGPRWSFAIEASTVLAKRSIYERFGLYDEEMKWSIDREMWWRWLDHGATMKKLNYYVSVYRRHEGQITSDRKKKNPDKQAKLLKHRQTWRKNISSENTILMFDYNVEKYIQEIV